MSTDFTPGDEQHDESTLLSDDEQELYHTLTRVGAAWRGTAAPEIERVKRQLEAQVALLSAKRSADGAPTRPIAQPRVTVSAPSGHSARMPAYAAQALHPRGARLRRWITTAATLVVIAGFVAALAATHRPTSAPSQSQGGQNNATGASQSDLDAYGWAHLTRLDDTARFDANDPPAMAPSNPNVVYETMAQGMQEHQPASIRATRDGGKTWRTLALPFPADHIGYAGISVSPINPQVIFLSLIDTVPADCPANRLESPGQGYGSFCRLEYTSVNGGASWSVSNLPLADGVSPGLLIGSMNSGQASPMLSNSVSAQGQRLLSGFLCTGFSCTRLVTSSDGGVTWTFTDQMMRAGGAKNICDYTTSAANATVYATTSAGECGYGVQNTLWVSHDAGATWTKVGQLATVNERGMVMAQNTATGASLLYMGLPRTTAMSKDKMGDPYPVISQSPSDVIVSEDGGQTWQHAPTQGIPVGDAVYFQIGPLGTLHDGSVLMDVIHPTSANGADAENFEGSAIYAWKPGDTSWRYITSVTGEIDGLVVNPAPSGETDTFRAILVNRSGGGVTFAFIQHDGIH